MGDLDKAPAMPIETSRRRDWHLDVLIAALLALVAAWFRFVELDRPGVWFDESSSCRWIEFPIPELIERTAGDCHPPLYWMLLGVWSRLFGHSVGVLRSMGAIFGVATVVATYFLVVELFRDNGSPRHPNARFAATLAGLLVALSPFHIEWSQEMRMYSLGTLEAVLSTQLLIVGLRARRAMVAVWGSYAAIGIASLYTMYFSVFGLIAHGLFVVVRGFVTGMWSREYLVAAALIAAGFAPWVPALWSMYGTVQHSFPQGPLSWSSFLSVFCSMFVHPGVAWPDELVPIALVQVCIAVVVVLLLDRRLERVLVGLCAVVPFWAILNVSLTSQNLVARHRMILGQLFLLIGWGLLVGGIRRKWGRWGLATASVTISLWLACGYVDFRREKAILPGMRAAMSDLDDSRAPDEPVLFVNPMLYLNGVVYAANRHNMFAAGKRENFPYFQGASLTRNSDHLPLSDLPPTARAVWVVDADNWMGGNWRLNVPRDWILAGETRYQEHYAQIVVRLYRRSE